MRSTSLRSPRSVTTLPDASTTSANGPTVTATKKHDARSSVASATRSTPAYAPTLTAERTGSGGQPGTTLQPSVAGQRLNTGTSEQPLPNPTTRLRPPARARHGQPPRARTTALDTNRLRAALRLPGPLPVPNVGRPSRHQRSAHGSLATTSTAALPISNSH